MLANGNNITTVAHYKDAAERHLQVCAILFEQLKYPQNFKNRNKWHNIIAELYYLSGYIVECTINYKYLTSIEGFLDNEGYDIRPYRPNVRIKMHFRFTTNSISCQTILSSLPSAILPNYLVSLGCTSSPALLGNELIIKEMQEKWDPKIRYAYESTGLLFSPSTSINDVQIYYKAAKDLFNNLI